MRGSGVPARVAAVAGFVLFAHLGSGVPAFHADVRPEPGWERFRVAYGVSHFGDDGQFVRAVQNGYNLVFFTGKYASRFSRRTNADTVNACASCHTVEDLAYAFVNSDRHDPRTGERL